MERAGRIKDGKAILRGGSDNTRAAAVTPGKKGSVRIIDVAMPGAGDDQALIKVFEVGIDGTDVDINEGKYGQAPEGADHLIIGHEAIGIIERAGKGVRCLRPGDLVVPTVRRPCPEHCYNCRNCEADMCITGNYLERGIKGLHGYMSEYYVERMENLIYVPPALKDVAVLLEPLSVAEKGIGQAYKVQERLLWEPKRALVLGAGSLGLLATFILRDKGMETYTVATRGHESLKARLAEECGARYVSSREEPMSTLPGKYGAFDVIIEATGVSKLATEAKELVNKNGVVCLLGLYPGEKEENVCTSCINMSTVLNNKINFGSVSSNRTHFERGVKRLASIGQKWPGLLKKMFTKTVPLEHIADGLRHDPENIKVLVEISR